MKYSVVCVISLLLFAACGDNKTHAPDLTADFERTKVCNSTLPDTRDITLEWYRENSERDPAVAIRLTAERKDGPDFQSMQHNAEGRYLLIKTGGKWERVSSKTFIEFLRHYVPDIYLTDDGYIRFADTEKFACEDVL